MTYRLSMSWSASAPHSPERKIDPVESVGTVAAHAGDGIGEARFTRLASRESTRRPALCAAAWRMTATTGVGRASGIVMSRRGRGGQPDCVCQAWRT